MIDQVDPKALDREIVREGGLAEMVKMTWHLVEPGRELLWTWHLDLVCAHLEAVTRGEIRNLIINIPPGCMKSLLVCVFWPIWEWTINPTTTWMYASYDASLTIKQSNQAKQIVDSEWFQERWGEKAKLSFGEVREGRTLTPVSYNKDLTLSGSESSTKAGGYRFATSVGGRATGRHVDRQIVDDPNKPKDVQGSRKAVGQVLKTTNQWWSGTMASRAKEPKTFSRVIIMQRLHESDLAGTALKTGEYVHLCLPMAYSKKFHCKTQWGEDPRTEEGELLWPERFDAAWDKRARSAAGLGPRDYSAQCDQRPSPPGGTIFKLAKKQHWTPETLPKNMQLIQSWDCTFKNTDSSDYVGGGVWGVSGPDYYMLDGHMSRMDLTETCTQILLWRKKWPKARKILIEDAANGPGVVSTLSKKVGGMELISPMGGKEARANAVEPYWTGGNIWLPPLTSENSEWLGPMLHQCEFFPYSSFDDMIDQMTQAVLWLETKSHSTYIDAITNMINEMR